MTETVDYPVPPIEAETSAESEPRVAAFETAKGSVYTYDAEGKTTRFKTVTGEKHERQDLTVFLPLTEVQERKFLEALHLRTVGHETKVYVVERLPDDSVKVLRDRAEIDDPSRVYLGIFEDGKMLGANQVSLVPVVGYNVYDTRTFEEDGKTYTDRHLGNKVTEINYE